MIALDDFAALQRRADKAKQEAAEAAGSLATLTDRLRAEFECGSLEDAETLLKTLEKRERKLADVYHEKKTAFDEKWAKLEKE